MPVVVPRPPTVDLWLLADSDVHGPHRLTAPDAIDGQLCGIFVDQQRWLVTKLHLPILEGVRALS